MDRLVWTAGVTAVAPGVFVTGEIPRHTAYEDTGGQFFLDPACSRPDPIPDDQAVYFDTAPGIVVLLGCAHAGVINTLDYVRQFSGRPIHAVIGGMHLVHATPARLSHTIAELKRIAPAIIAPAHCTGRLATAALQNTFPLQFADCSAGAQWSFDPL